MPINLPTSYDELPYTSHAFAGSHPAWMATIGALFGMKPPELSRCRILELGCASGGNLFPIAESLPGSECLGIDLSGRQIAEGQKRLLDLGLTNIKLKEASILDLDESLGTFDYIITHGVYSWVPNEVRSKILELSSKLLCPSGIAYVSYNTYPGWHMSGMLRDMMRFHASRFPSPAEQVEQARALLSFLADAVPQENNPYGLLLRTESHNLQKKPDYYIFHDHLEQVNDPVYFHQFVEAAAEHDLQFLGESEVRTMLMHQFPKAVTDVLAQVATNLIQVEQYMDFLRNRTFRMSLLCKKGTTLNRRLNAESVLPFRFSSPMLTEASATSLLTREPIQFGAPTRPTVTVSDPMGKAILLVLGEVWPNSLSLAELELEVRRRTGHSSTPNRASTLALADILWKWFTLRVVDPSIHQPRCIPKPGVRPLASIVSRDNARRGERITTNLLHETVPITQEDAEVLRLLDGSRDRQQIGAQLALEAATEATGTPGTANATPLAERVERALTRLARAGLLLG